MMYSVLLIFPIAFISQTDAKKVVDDLVDRVLKAWPLRRANVDEKSLWKPRLTSLQSGRVPLPTSPPMSSRFGISAAAALGRDGQTFFAMARQRSMSGVVEGSNFGNTPARRREGRAGLLERLALLRSRRWREGRPRAMPGSDELASVETQTTLPKLDDSEKIEKPDRMPPIRAGAALRRELSRESLARSYYRFPAPGTVVHIAYLRAPYESNLTINLDEWREAVLQGLVKGSAEPERKTTEKEDVDQLTGEISGPLRNRRGAEDKAARKNDYKHFEQLLLELEDGVTEPPIGGLSDCRVKLKLPLGVAHMDSEVPEWLKAREDIAHRGDAYEEEVEVRYQQFTEFSSYTFVMSGPGGKDGTSFAERGGVAVTTLLERGERLVDCLKGLSSWYYELPGEPFLVAVVVNAPVTSPEGCEDKWDSQICNWEDQAFLGALPENTSTFIGPEAPVGALIGSRGRAAIISSYVLQPSTEHLHAAVLYADVMDQTEFEEVSRRTYDFLELEQYRLLTLASSAIAKNVFPTLASINEGVLEVLNDLRSDGEPEDVTSQLGQLIALQTRCEALEVEVRERFAASEAYGNVVQRRLDSLNSGRALGAITFQRFVRGRIDPTLRTYQIAGIRLEETTAAVTRATSLLRTIVEQDIQQTNDQLLILGTVLSFGSLALGVFNILLSLNVIRPIPT